MHKVINIPSNEAMFYTQYLTIMNPLFGANALRGQEIGVLSLMYKLLDDMQGSWEQKNMALFNIANIRRMIMTVNISRAGWDNIMYSLRKKKFIIKDEEGISSVNQVFIPETKSVMLNFIINDNQ